MASSSAGGRPGPSQMLQSSGSEQDGQQMMDQRKRKRMISNRESARRSRLRKQKLVEDLTAQASQLRSENHHILTNMNITTRLYFNVVADNSALRSQVAELTHRLKSLHDIVDVFSLSNHGGLFQAHDCPISGADEFLSHPWNLLYASQPIVASADVFMC